MALLTMAGQGRERVAGTVNSTLALSWGGPGGQELQVRPWFFHPSTVDSPSQPDRPSPASLPAFPLSRVRFPQCFTFPQAQPPHFASNSISVHPPHCRRSHLLKTYYAGTAPSFLKHFHWLPIARPVKPRLLSVARHCGIWLILATNSASLPADSQLPPPSSFQIRDLRPGHSSLRLVVTTFLWS